MGLLLVRGPGQVLERWQAPTWRRGHTRGEGASLQPLHSALPPLSPLFYCVLVSTRWIFLAVPILLPPVRAVLEPAKWLRFKPRAAGRAAAKPPCPPDSPPLLQLWLQVILSPAGSWAAPSLLCHNPCRPAQPFQLPGPCDRASGQDTQGAVTCPLPHSLHTCTQTPTSTCTHINTHRHMKAYVCGHVCIHTHKGIHT